MSEVWMFGLLLSTLIKLCAGLTGCGGELVSSTDLSSELQSDILLPCYFKPALLRSNTTKDLAVIWTQMNSNLLEMDVNGAVRHWNSKEGRIQVFPELSASGNFSIVLEKLQSADQGLYRCELFEGINCIIAYQEVNLSVTSCRTEQLHSMNIAAELQSDVLLPCYFKPALLQAHSTENIVAVWSYRNITVENLLEISLQGDVRSWNIRGGRIETFPKLSESGNFSILLHKVQQSDLGLYHCQLFKGISCVLAQQDIYILSDAHSFRRYWFRRYWFYILGAGLTLSLLLVCLCFILWRKRRASHNHLYVNTNFHQNRRNEKEEAIYENELEIIEEIKSTNRRFNPRK